MFCPYIWLKDIIVVYFVIYFLINFYFSIIRAVVLYVFSFLLHVAHPRCD